MNSGGIVLCGGKSSRMGTSKALLPFGPETMLQRVVRLVASVVSPVVVAAARDQELPDLPQGVIVTRDDSDERGPLEGMRAGFRALPVPTEIAYVTSCDAPLLVPAYVTRMIELLDDFDAAVLEADEYLHPLSAAYRRSVLPHIESMLAANNLRATLLLDRVRTRRVQPAEVAGVDPQLLSLRNVNTREDYLAALTLLM